MSKTIQWGDDILDSRDIIERITELEEAQAEAIEDGSIDEWEDDYGEELDVWRLVAQNGEDSPDWEYGEALIEDTYFVAYAQELAEDIGAVSLKDQPWPLCHIDWEAAADALQQDYFPLEVSGWTYWIRS